MTNRKYEIGNWYPWTGGECPVPGVALANVKNRSGDETTTPLPAGGWSWNHNNGKGDIIAFCVTEYPDEVVTEKQNITIHDNLDDWRDDALIGVTCTYRNSKLVEVHWKDESDE